MKLHEWATHPSVYLPLASDTLCRASKLERCRSTGPHTLLVCMSTYAAISLRVACTPPAGPMHRGLSACGDGGTLSPLARCPNTHCASPGYPANKAFRIVESIPPDDADAPFAVSMPKERGGFGQPNPALVIPRGSKRSVLNNSSHVTNFPASLLCIRSRIAPATI